MLCVGKYYKNYICMNIAHLFHSWPISKIFTANKLKQKNNFKILKIYNEYYWCVLILYVCIYF